MVRTHSGGQTRVIILAAAISALFGVLASLLVVGYLRQKELQSSAAKESARAMEAASRFRDAANLGNRARDEAEEMVEFILDDLRHELSAIGRSDLLVAAAGKAVDYFDHLPPELVTRDSKINHASVLFSLAQTRQDTGDLEGAITACQRCIDLRREIAATDDPDGYQSYRLGRSLGELGHFYKAAGDLEKARESYELGLRHFQNPPPGADTEGDWRYGMAQSLNGLGSIQAKLGHPDEALAAHAEAIGHLSEALKHRPDEVLWVNQLGLAYNNSGVVHKNARNYPAAETNYLGALAAVRSLVRIEPENRTYEKQLATVLSNLGSLINRQQDYERAEQFFRESLAVRQGLVSWDSKNTRWLLDLAHGWGYLADFQFQRNQTSNALSSARAGLEVFRRLFSIDATHKSWVRDFQTTLEDHKEQLVDAGMRQEALSLFQEAAAYAEQTQAAQPDLEVWSETLDAFQRGVRQLGGAVASASLIEPRRRRLASLARALQVDPESPQRNYQWAVACVGLGRAFRDGGLPGSALPCVRKARQVLLDRVPAGHENRDLILDEATKLDVELAVELGEIRKPAALVATGDSWRYWDRAEAPGLNWNLLAFEDQDWKEGPSPLGYGEPDIATKLSYGSNSRNKPLAAWFRRRFVIEDPSDLTHLYIALRRDDGAVVYVNGKEVLRSGLPKGKIAPETVARMTQDEEETIYRTFRIDTTEVALVPGLNVVAVEVRQNEAASSDLCLDMEILPNFTPPAPRVSPESVVQVLEDALPAVLE